MFDRRYGPFREKKTVPGPILPGSPLYAMLELAAKAIAADMRRAYDRSPWSGMGRHGSPQSEEWGRQVPDIEIE
jgi:hypothetical protein